MKKNHYTTEFKREMVKAFYSQSLCQTDFAKSQGIHPKTFTNWLNQEVSKKSEEQQDHLKRLKMLEKENRELRMEREILKKAAAFFAKESR